MILNDLYCPSCGTTRSDVMFRPEQMPFCPCGTQLRQDWSHGRAPATDLGSPRMFQGLDAEFSSTKQAENAAKQRAAEWTRTMQDQLGKNISWKIDGQAGDKKGGARDVRRLRGSAFSYVGQHSHVSTGERKPAPR